MYFNLPKSSERQKTLNKKHSSSSILSTDSTSNNTTSNALMAEDRISEIIHNLDDHWGSPPILTPDTLAHILNHQWISTTTNSTEEQVDFKKKSPSIINHSKVNSTKNNVTRKDLKLLSKSNSSSNQKVISNLITELCKTIQVIDTENKFELTNDIKNDPVIQKFILSKEQQQGQPEDVLEHLVELLKHHNKASTPSP